MRLIWRLAERRRITILVTVALLIAAITIWSALTDSLKEEVVGAVFRAGPATRRTIALNVAISPSNIGVLSTLSDYEVRYAVRRVNDRIQVTPVLPYLEIINAGGPIHPRGFHGSFDWRYPTIDLKLVNNTKETVFITEAIIRVRRSMRVQRPLIVIGMDRCGRRLPILNEGWEKARNSKLAFRFVQPNVAVRHPTERSAMRTVLLGDIADYHSVDLSDALIASGVDLANLDSHRLLHMAPNGNVAVTRDEYGRTKRMSRREFNELRRTWMGPFGDGIAPLSGHLEYDERSTDGPVRHRKLKVEAPIYFDKGCVQFSQVVPSAHHYASLRIDGSDYEQRVNVSQIVKPGEADRFQITVGAMQSSLHELQVELVYNSDEVIKTPRIDIELFVPRSANRD